MILSCIYVWLDLSIIITFITFIFHGGFITTKVSIILRWTIRRQMIRWWVIRKWMIRRWVIWRRRSKIQFFLWLAFAFKWWLLFSIWIFFYFFIFIYLLLYLWSYLTISFWLNIHISTVTRRLIYCMRWINIRRCNYISCRILI